MPKKIECYHFCENLQSENCLKIFFCESVASFLKPEITFKEKKWGESLKFWEELDQGVF
jgi:hypothetical protein